MRPWAAETEKLAIWKKYVSLGKLLTLWAGIGDVVLYPTFPFNLISSAQLPSFLEQHAMICVAREHLRLTTNQQGDHNDVCASCGSGGNLVLCASCDTAFHALCREPPVDPKNPEAFFCSRCVARKRGSRERPTGLFSALLDKLEEKNPYSFRLPSRIATYFEGVKLGSEGQYVSVPEPRPKYVSVGLDGEGND